MTTAAPAEPIDPSPADAMTKAILFVGLMVFAMGQTILFALAGPVARDIGLAEWQIGAIVSAAAIMFVLVSPVWGRLSDRWGRRTVISGGLFAYGVTTLMFAAVLYAGLQGWVGAALAFAGLLGARLLYALLSGGIQPASMALMADVTSARDRSAGLALIGAGFGLGAVLGPALAAMLVRFGVLTPLFTVAALSAVMAVLTRVWIREPVRHVASGQGGLDARIDLRALAPALALAFGAYVAISTLQQTTAFYIQDFTGSDAARAAQLSGYAFMALAAATLLVQGAVVQAFKPTPSRMLGIGLPLSALGVAVYLAAPNLIWVIAGFAVMGAGFGLVQPGINAFASLQVDAGRQGGVAGYAQAAAAGGFVVGPLAGTLLYGLTPRAPLMLALGSLVLCVLLFALLSRRQAQPA